MPDDKERADDRITVSFPQSIGHELRDVADEMAIPVSILIKQWVVERLRQVRRERDSNAR